MKPKDCDVVVVGSGIAGIAAARKMADSHLRILLLDENPRAGGQILRSLPKPMKTEKSYRFDRWIKAGQAVMDHLRDKKIIFMNRATVLGMDGERELLIEEKGAKTFSIKPRAILFATGARERFLPFKGWTLPGVLSTGAVQILMKSAGIIPSREILIGGAGLFLFTVAYEFVRSRGRVLAVLEQGFMLRKMPSLSLLFSHSSKFAEGSRYLGRLILSRVPVRHRTVIVEARGERFLEEVVTARVDHSGRLLQGSERVYRTPTLAIGYGFVPNIELPQVAGCALTYDGTLGGWIVKVTNGLETTKENIFAAGEITGIGGARKSLIEGHISGMSILQKLGKRVEKESLSRLKEERRKHFCFGRYFSGLYEIPDHAIASIADEAVVCRCEDLTMGDIRKAISEGHHTPGAIKKALRLGMGNCQGRICGPILHDVLSLYIDRPRREPPPFSVRTPVKPVRISTLLD
jgi:NADPH-dependent 2,4-dienoyl-CoA reductase/sulfur reductase-like enzyme/bacterioferritin-associated ferredoxin